MYVINSAIFGWRFYYNWGKWQCRNIPSCPSMKASLCPELTETIARTLAHHSPLSRCIFMMAEVPPNLHPNLNPSKVSMVIDIMQNKNPSLRCNERFPDQRSTSEGITGPSPVTGWHRPVISGETRYSVYTSASCDRTRQRFSSGVRNQLRVLFSRLFIDVSVTVVCWRTCLSPLFQSNRGVE